MLYLSLGIILIGAFIFVYSIIVDARTRIDATGYGSGDTRRKPPERMRASDVGPYAGIERTYGPFVRDRQAREGRVQAYTGGGGAAESDFQKADGFPVERRVYAEEGGPLRLSAVLYEDDSKAVDYGAGHGVAEPSVEEYRHIRRIGSGEFSVEKGGISFSTGRKLYRYDFHRIRDLKIGEGHCSLFLDGSDTVRLFIFDTPADRIGAIRAAYMEYRGGSG
jgi:hypothetical protein